MNNRGEKVLAGGMSKGAIVGQIIGEDFNSINYFFLLHNQRVI